MATLIMESYENKRTTNDKHNATYILFLLGYPSYQINILVKLT